MKTEFEVIGYFFLYHLNSFNSMIVSFMDSPMHATIASKVIVLKKEEGGQVKNRNQSMNDHVPLKKGEIHSGTFGIFLTTSIQKGPIIVTVISSG